MLLSHKEGFFGKPIVSSADRQRSSLWSLSFPSLFVLHFSPGYFLEFSVDLVIFLCGILMVFPFFHFFSCFLFGLGLWTFFFLLETLPLLDSLFL